MQEGFAGTGLTDEGNDVDIRIQQDIEGKILFPVTCGNAPDIVFAVHVVVQRFQHGRFSVELLYLCLKGCFAVLWLHIDELVDDHGRNERAADAVKSLLTP